MTTAPWFWRIMMVSCSVFSEKTTNGPKNTRVPVNKQNNKHQNPWWSTIKLKKYKQKTLPFNKGSQKHKLHVQRQKKHARWWSAQREMRDVCVLWGRSVKKILQNQRQRQQPASFRMCRASQYTARAHKTLLLLCIKMHKNKAMRKIHGAVLVHMRKHWKSDMLCSSGDL